MERSFTITAKIIFFDTKSAAPFKPNAINSLRRICPLRKSIGTLLAY